MFNRFRSSLNLRELTRASGFTLIEVLVATALMVIGVLGLAGITIAVIQGNYVSGNITSATSLAQHKMEELKAQTSLANVDNCANPPDQDITSTGAAGGIYDRCWTITDSALGTDLKQIEVTVSWTHLIARNVTLTAAVFTA